MTDTSAIRVAFVVDPNHNNSITALFPDFVNDVAGKYRDCFDPVGGHSGYSDDWAATCENVPPARQAEVDRIMHTLTHVYEYEGLVVVPYWGEMLPSCVRLYNDGKPTLRERNEAYAKERDERK